MSEQTRYEFRFHLMNGETVIEPVTEDEANAIATNASWIWHDNMPEDERPFAALYSSALIGWNKQKPFNVTDQDGRVWMIPAQSVVAFDLFDRRRPEPKRMLGFRPLQKSSAE